MLHLIVELVDKSRQKTRSQASREEQARLLKTEKEKLKLEKRNNHNSHSPKEAVAIRQKESSLRTGIGKREEK